jgi:YfiH family protein
VHGAEVVVVTAEDAADLCGTEADALVTTEPGLVLAAQTADCVPVTLRGDNGVIGLAHAGWRGLEAGVVERTGAAMRDLGATQITAYVGPYIAASCYEFGDAELQRLATRFGDRVRARTPDGGPALDLLEMVRSSWAGPVVLSPFGGDESGRLGHGLCTACHPERWYSHRARGEAERMATVVWREP